MGVLTMKTITVTVPAVVLTAATDPYDFEGTDDKTGERIHRTGQRRKVWLLTEPGEAPLECRVADDHPDWHDVEASQGDKLLVTVKVRGVKAATGNAIELVGDLLGAGPYDGLS